jgi:hypothetical protein
VGGRWRRGCVFARYERRWFEAIVYIVDTLARRVLISYLGEFSQLVRTCSKRSSNGQRAGSTDALPLPFAHLGL